MNWKVSLCVCALALVPACDEGSADDAAGGTDAVVGDDDGTGGPDGDDDDDNDGPDGDDDDDDDDEGDDDDDDGPDGDDGSTGEPEDPYGCIASCTVSTECTEARVGGALDECVMWCEEDATFSDGECAEALIARNECLGSLTCDGYEDWLNEPVPDYPCVDEDEAVYATCEGGREDEGFASCDAACSAMVECEVEPDYDACLDVCLAIDPIEDKACYWATIDWNYCVAELEQCEEVAGASSAEPGNACELPFDAMQKACSGKA